MLEIEVKSPDDFLLELDQLFAVNLLAEQVWEFIDHHLEAWVHVLVQLGSQKKTDCSELDKIWSHLTSLSESRKISIGHTNCDVKCLLTVFLYTVQFLNQANHALTILWLDPQGLLSVDEVVSDRLIFLHDGEIGRLRVLWGGLSSLVGLDGSLEVGILNIEDWHLLFELVKPPGVHDIGIVHLASLDGSLARTAGWGEEHVAEQTVWALVLGLLTAAL